MSEIWLERLTGERLRQHLPELARLRITVFRDFPYLYAARPRTRSATSRPTPRPPTA